MYVFKNKLHYLLTSEHGTSGLLTMTIDYDHDRFHGNAEASAHGRSGHGHSHKSLCRSLV